MFINAFMRALVLAMQARGMHKPLLQYIRICDLWKELCILSGSIIPEDVEQATQEPPFSGWEEE